MGLTTDWALPYPECNPPLRKDAGDIAQVRDLAEAMDADVQSLYDLAGQILIRPDACRMTVTATQTSVSNSPTFRPFYDAVTFDNSVGQEMSDTANGVLRILEPGYYLVGAWFLTSSATNQSMRARFLTDGSPAANPHGASNIITGTSAYLSMSQTIKYSAPAALSTEMISSTAVAWSITSRLWALQMVKF